MAITDGNYVVTGVFRTYSGSYKDTGSSCGCCNEYFEGIGMDIKQISKIDGSVFKIDQLITSNKE
jgi:hypothetical protein